MCNLGFISKLENREEPGYDGFSVSGGEFRQKSGKFDHVDSEVYVFPPERKNLISIDGVGSEKPGLDSGKIDRNLLASQVAFENRRFQSFDNGNLGAWSKKSVSELGGSESIFGIGDMDTPGDLVREGLDVPSGFENEGIGYGGRRYYPPLNAFQPKIINSKRKMWKAKASKYLLNQMTNSESR